MLKEKILEYFIENDTTVSLSVLAREFDVSRNACWKAINKLKEEGYLIESDKKGYKYLISDKLNATLINTRSNIFKCIDVFDSISSTNTVLKSMADLDSFSVIVSDEQTSGRGRRGKSFTSIKGNGAYFTLYIKDQLDVSDASFITICSAVALRRCLMEKYNFKCDIKWLNDIYYNRKKLCGILTEVTISAEEGCVEDIYVGIGINTLTVDESIKDIATSIEQITSHKVDRNELIANILNYFYIVYEECFKNGKKDQILDEYISYQFIIGMNVEIHNNEEVTDAIVKSINNKGELVVEIDGCQKVINNGTIVLKGDQNEY